MRWRMGEGQRAAGSAETVTGRPVPPHTCPVDSELPMAGAIRAEMTVTWRIAPLRTMCGLPAERRRLEA